ncbi:MAG: nucleotidyltransferase domain-containing protein [Myxococcales bacterium]
MTRLPGDILRSVALFRSELDRRFGPRLCAVTLFGSRARGDAELDSDVDVMVVVEGLSEVERGEAIDLAFAARRAAGGGPLLSPLVWSDAQWRARLAAERRIALDIVREGIPL